MKWTAVNKSSSSSLLDDADHDKKRLNLTTKDNTENLEFPHPFGVYSITRLNPIYVDEEDGNYNSSSAPSIKKKEDTRPFDNSTNSDYYRHPTENSFGSANLKSSSEDSNTSVKHSSIVPLNQQRLFDIDRLLTTIPENRISPPPPRPIWPRDGNNIDNVRNNSVQSNGRCSSSVSNSPRYELNLDRRKVATTALSSSDDDDYVKMPPFSSSGCSSSDSDKAVSRVLKELSISVNAAIDDMEAMEMPSEHVLRALQDKIGESIRILSGYELSEEQQQQDQDNRGGTVSNNTVVDRNQVTATLSRAFSFVDAFKARSQVVYPASLLSTAEEEKEAELQLDRAELFKKWGKFSPLNKAINDRMVVVKKIPSSTSKMEQQQQQSTTSSSSLASTTSGFSSDLTHTPASASPSESPSAASRTAVGNNETAAQNNVFIIRSSSRADDDGHRNNNNNINQTKNVHEINHNNASTSSSSSNSSNVSNGSTDCCIINGHHDNNDIGGVNRNGLLKLKNSLTALGDYSSIVQTTTNFLNNNLSSFHKQQHQRDQRQMMMTTVISSSFNQAAATNRSRDDNNDAILVDDKKEPTAAVKSGHLLSSYPGHRCPDFTLDVQQAERLMRKINANKKQKFWCQIVTPFLGFVFLIFSVMFFSMILSRGERMFGSV